MFLCENGQYYWMVDDESCRRYRKILDSQKAFEKRRIIKSGVLFNLIMGDIFLVMILCVCAMLFPGIADGYIKPVVIVCGFIGLGLLTGSILMHVISSGLEAAMYYDLKEAEHAMLSGERIPIFPADIGSQEAENIINIRSQ